MNARVRESGSKSAIARAFAPALPRKRARVVRTTRTLLGPAGDGRVARSLGFRADGTLSDPTGRFGTAGRNIADFERPRSGLGAAQGAGAMPARSA